MEIRLGKNPLLYDKPYIAYRRGAGLQVSFESK